MKNPQLNQAQKAFIKVKKTIESCQTTMQYSTALCLYQLFAEKYTNIYHIAKHELLVKLLDDKYMKLVHGITPLN